MAHLSLRPPNIYPPVAWRWYLPPARCRSRASSLPDDYPLVQPKLCHFLDPRSWLLGVMSCSSFLLRRPVPQIDSSSSLRMLSSPAFSPLFIRILSPCSSLAAASCRLSWKKKNARCLLLTFFNALWVALQSLVATSSQRLPTKPSFPARQGPSSIHLYS